MQQNGNESNNSKDIGHGSGVVVKEYIHTKTFAHARYFINENFSTDNCSKWTKCCKQISILKFLWKMVDEQVCTFRS